MTLHENTKLYMRAISFTANLLGLPDIYIEKDYWITKALLTIYSNDIGKETIFKGGTALSKCHGIRMFIV